MDLMKANNISTTESSEGSIAKLRRRIPLTLKVVMLNLVIGLVGWTIMDYVQTANLRSIFHEQLTEDIKHEAQENSIVFNNYLKAFEESAGQSVANKEFENHIENIIGNIKNSGPSHHYNSSPPWFSENARHSSFPFPRYALLINASGNIIETYNRTERPLPSGLLNNAPDLAERSRNQNHIQIINDTPIIFTSDSYTGQANSTIATLLLASPIDHHFIKEAMGEMSHGHIISLMTRGEDSHVLASNNPAELPPGVQFSTLKKNYLVNENNIYESLLSGVNVRFISLVSQTKAQMWSSSVISESRRERAVSVIVLLGIFLLVTYRTARHLQGLNTQITDFCRNTLGMTYQENQKGDQLHILKDRFSDLQNEVIKSREIIQNQAEEHTRLIVNNAFDGIITTNSQGTITSWNPMAEKIFGWNSEEAVGEIIYYFIVSEKYHNLCQKTFKRFMSKGEWPLEKQQITITALRRNRKKFIAEVSFSPAIKNHKPMMIFTVRDITKRKNTENKIKSLLSSVRKAKREWEATFDNVAALIMLADKDLNILRCNKSFADFAGLSAAAMIGRKCYDFLPCDPEWFSFKEYANSKEGSMKTEVHTDSGHWLYVNYLPIFDENNLYLYTIIIATDITELKDTQQILMGSRKELKKRIAELEKFYEIAVNRELKMKDLKKEIVLLKNVTMEDDAETVDLLNHKFPDYRQSLQ